MTNEIALKPCPFCGPGQSMVDPWYDDVSKRWAVGCGRCGASSGRSVHAEGSKEAAIKSWNTRALPAQGEPVATEQIDAGAQALANDVWHPPQKLENMTGSEANKFRRQARIVIVAALPLVKP